MSKADRRELQQRLFPAGIPSLWCPTLSYFSSAGQLDAQRIGQHMERLAPCVRGLLVPGSTGEGWEMSDQQILELLNIVLPLADQLKMQVLIGILKTETEQVLRTIDGLGQLLNAPAVIGVTVCAAKGADKTQEVIHSELKRVLKLGIPTALYQLPQVTQNEMSWETVASLAAEFPNFILFKDTSGDDRVANSIADSQGVFMVRGSEQNGYSRWLRGVGGHYDGFLLSTANCFSNELSQIIQHCAAGDQVRADQLSQEVSLAVGVAFEVVSGLPVGNAFTNANKAMDHLLVYGVKFRDHPSPMLNSGVRLPIDVLETLAQRCPQLIGVKHG